MATGTMKWFNAGKGYGFIPEFDGARRCEGPRAQERHARVGMS